MQRKRIIYLITKSNFGGAQKYVYELATSLDPGLFDVSVALGGDGLLKDKLEESGIRTITIPGLVRDIKFFKEFQILNYLIKLFREEDPDIVHLNSAKISGIGSVAARLTGVPKIIFTAHGWEFNNDHSNIKKIFFKFLSWLTILFSDKTIAVSKAIRKQMIGWPFVYNKFQVIWNGVKEIEFYEKEYSKNHLYNLSSHKLDLSKRWVGTVAELHPIKGIDVLINSAKEVLKKEDVQFVVMGDGELKEKLEKQIKDLDLENNFILLGYIDEAPKYLRAFDVFALSSHSEALSLAILEAGLASVPVVATEVGGIPEIILDHELGVLVESNNSENLSSAIVHLLQEPDRAVKSSRALKTRVSLEFSHETMVNKTVSLY